MKNFVTLQCPPRLIPPSVNPYQLENFEIKCCVIVGLLVLSHPELLVYEFSNCGVGFDEIFQ
jgi:hypothetical protein